MHLRGGRGNVPRPRNQHERNQGISGQSRGGDKATVSKNTEVGTKPQWKTGEPEQIHIYIHEKVTTLFQISKKLHKNSDFQWTSKAERAFQDMIQCIPELPMVTTPKPKEEMIIYLCATKEAISAVLLRERDGLSLAPTSFPHLTKQVLLEVLKEKSIEEKEILVIMEEEGYSGMTLLIKYLSDGTLSADTKEARAIQIKARFGLPGEIKSDNGKQFRDNPFKDIRLINRHKTHQ
ncbi:reverse transcriptase domain-containing protein [Tanacetum coccineum]